METWFSIDVTQVSGILLSTLLTYAGLILIVRINGVRSFAKISGHDFAVTVAIGSILATSVLSKEPSILQALLAIAALLFWKTIITYMRTHLHFSIFDNEPCVVMRDGQIYHDALKRSNFTEDELFGKLRESNVLNLDQVRVAVVESTGDFSILHGNREEFDPIMLKGVGENKNADTKTGV